MKKFTDRLNIIRDTSFFSGSIYITQTMNFIKGFLNAKILGPALYGLWSALNILLNYGSYVHFGSLNAMNREIPYQQGRCTTENVSKVKHVTFTFCATISLIFSVIIFIMAFLLGKRGSLVEMWGLISVALLVFLSIIYEFYETLFVVSKKFLILSKNSIIFSISGVILTLILVPTFKIYGVYLVALLIILSSILYFYFKEPYRFRLYFDFKEIFRLIKIGLPLVSIDFLRNTIMNIAGITVLTFLGRVDMGYFSVAILAGQFLTYFLLSIERIFEPHMFQKYGETNSILELEKYLFRPTLVISLLFPVILAFYYTGVTFFVRHFLSKYSISLYPFLIILISRFFISFSPTATVFITAINKQKFLVPVFLTGIAIISGFSFIFINMGFGIIGVALALLLSFFFIGSVIFIYAIHHYIRNPFMSFVYLIYSCSPLLYMLGGLIFIENFFLNSFNLFSDFQKVIFKLGILSIFSLPLIWIANVKTGIISDFLKFLSLERLVLKKLSMNRK